MKKLFTLLFALLLVWCGQAAAQDKPADAPAPKDTSWKKKFEVGLNASQTTISNNWVAGGANAYSVTALFNATANYKKGNVTWDNRLELIYSQVWNAPNIPRKANDRIWLDSKVGYNVSKSWAMFGAANFQSQFYRGEVFGPVANSSDPNTYATTISAFMAPGFLVESFGMEYKPVPYFYVRFGVFSMRQTFQLSQEVANNVALNYGAPFGRTGVRNEGASQILAEFNKDVVKNINVLVRGWAFKAWQTPWNSDEINARVDLNITAKVNKVVSANFVLVTLYQKEQHPFWQTSTALSAGLLYTF
jgi:hypothetical protein